MKIHEVAEYIKTHMDFPRYARLTKALGKQTDAAQLRFIKALIFERSVEIYSKGRIKYVGEEGCDLYIPALEVRGEKKYTEDALYTPKKKILREKTGNIKLMNSMGTNTHNKLPEAYADYLIFIGNQGAMLFSKETLEEHLNVGGDGISANIPTEKGVLLASPEIMNSDDQKEIDFIDGLMKYIDTYIQSVKRYAYV